MFIDLISANKISFLHTATEYFPKIESPCTLWNFSDNYLSFVKLAKKKPSHYLSGNTGDLLDSSVMQFKTQFINIDEKITTNTFYKSYLASSMGERNPDQDGFFLNLCRAISLKKLAKIDGHHIILISNTRLGNAFIQTCNSMGVSAKWVSLAPSTKFKYFKKVCRAFGSGLILIFRQWRLRGKLKYARNFNYEPDSIWLLNWVNGKISNSDPFYGDLPIHFNSLNLKITWVANLMHWLIPTNKVIDQVDHSGSNKIATIDLISFKTIFYAIFGWLVFPFSIKRHLSFKDWDLSYIVSHALRQELTTPRIMLALLYGDIARILVKRKIEPKIFICPFENQPWEKILIAGFRKHCPSTKIIGMQYSPTAENYVSCIPSKRQWRENVVPDTIVTIGKEFSKRLIENLAPENRLEIGGFYRNPALTITVENFSKQPNRENLILVSCPMNQLDSIELIHKAALATIDIKNIQVLVNFHPMVAKSMNDELINRINELTDCGHLKFVKGTAQNWLKECNMLIYNTSGTVFDANAAGVPSICVARESQLDLDKMPVGNKLKCKDTHTLKKTIERIITEPSFTEEIIQHARKSMEYSFSQPNPEIWNKVIYSFMSAEKP